MCDPITIGIISLGIAGASAGANYASQKSDANRANKENAEYAAKNKQAAIDAAMFNESQLSLRQSQEILAASAQIHDIQKETDSSVSTATVSAAEAGLSGNSLDAVIADIKTKSGTNKVRTQQNLRMKLDQIDAEKQGVLVEAQNNINTVRSTVVRGPSILTPIFQVGGAALNFANQNADRNARAKGDH